MKPSKGTDQSYELNCLSNEAKEGGLRLLTCHYTNPNAIVVGVASGTQSLSATFTLYYKYNAVHNILNQHWEGTLASSNM
jgi:hypothetical protein